MKQDLRAGCEPLPGYRLVRFLGRGGFGEVWETIAPGDVPKALKICPVGNENSASAVREIDGINRIRSIRHPYLLSIERFEIVKGSLFIVMELAEKSLADRFDECIREGRQGIPRRELLCYLEEAAEALDLLNQRHNLFHLDVKPENLFLLGGHVKVADFGLVQSRTAGEVNRTLAITPPYAPPEIFDGVVESSVDQYGLAITYQEMLTGFRPYSASDIRGIVYQHLREGPNLSPLAMPDRPLVRRALSPDPSQRYESCIEMIAALAAAPVADDEIGEVRPATPASKGISSDLSKPKLVSNPTRHRREKTTALSTSRHRTVPFNVPYTGTPSVDPHQLQDHFVAFLPLEIFAHKLRGFITDLQAEVLNLAPDHTVLRFRPSRMFAGKKAVFLQIDTCVKNPHSGYRVVEATVWGVDDSLVGEELARRGHLLVRYLKAHMMAVDREPLWAQLTSDEIRSVILE